MKWFPTGSAIKREIVLGLIAGAASFAMAYYLRKRFEKANGVSNG